MPRLYTYADGVIAQEDNVEAWLRWMTEGRCVLADTPINCIAVVTTTFTGYDTDNPDDGGLNLAPVKLFRVSVAGGPIDGYATKHVSAELAAREHEWLCAGLQIFTGRQ